MDFVARRRRWESRLYVIDEKKKNPMRPFRLIVYNPATRIGRTKSVSVYDFSFKLQTEIAAPGEESWRSWRESEARIRLKPYGVRPEWDGEDNFG